MPVGVTLVILPFSALTAAARADSEITSPRFAFSSSSPTDGGIDLSVDHLSEQTHYEKIKKSIPYGYVPTRQSIERIRLTDISFRKKIWWGMWLKQKKTMIYLQR